MSKKKEDFDFIKMIEKFYYFLRYKLHFDDIQASTFIVSIFLVPISAYLGFNGDTVIILKLFYLLVVIDVLVIIYSIIKFKWFRKSSISNKPKDKLEKVSINTIEQIDQLSGIDFEKFVEQYYISKGYKTEITQGSHDFGADIIADKGKETIVIEAKRRIKKIRKDTVLFVDFAKGEYKANKAVIFTSSELTEQAKVVALKKGVKYIDRYEIKRILKNNRNINLIIRKAK